MEVADLNAATQSPAGPPARLRRGLALWVGVIAFALFALSAAPDVTAEDAGELTIAAATLGIPHPPGYPAWTFLGHAWLQVVPGRNPAHGLALFSAAASALGIALLVALAIRRTGSLLGGATFGLTLAVSGNLWRQSAIVEVYGLTLVLLAAALCLADALARSPTRGRALAFGLVLGSGITHHPTFWIAAPVLGGAVLVGIWQGWRADADSSGVATSARPSALRRLRCLLLFGSAGLLFGLCWWVYLPLAAGGDSPLRWMATQDLDSFVGLVTRRVYQAPAWADVPGLLPGRLLVAARSFVTSFGVLATGLALFGAAVAWRTPRLRRPLLVLAALGGLLVVAVLARINTGSPPEHEATVVDTLTLPAQILLALGIAVGVGAIDHRGRRWRRGLAVALAFAAVAMPAIAHGHLRAAIRAEARAARAYTEAQLAPLPRGALLLTNNDIADFPARYRQWREHFRPDVTLLPLLNQDDPTARLARQALAAGRPTFAASITQSVPSGYRLRPEGLVYRVVKADALDRPAGIAEPRYLHWLGRYWRRLRLDAPIAPQRKLPAGSEFLVGYRQEFLAARGLASFVRGERAAARRDLMAIDPGAIQGQALGAAGRWLAPRLPAEATPLLWRACSARAGSSAQWRTYVALVRTSLAIGDVPGAESALALAQARWPQFAALDLVDAGLALATGRLSRALSALARYEARADGERAAARYLTLKARVVELTEGARAARPWYARARAADPNAPGLRDWAARAANAPAR